MTFLQLRQQVQDMVGNPTDLESGAGLTALDQAINDSLVHVANWKDLNGYRVRHRKLHSDMNFQMITLAGVVESVTSSTLTDTTGEIGLDNGQYDDWIIEINSEVYKIVSSNGGVLTIQGTFTTTPSVLDTFTLYKRFAYFVDSAHTWASEHIVDPSTVSGNPKRQGRFLEVLKVIDLETNAVLDMGVRGDFQYASSETVGVPGVWWMYGDRLFLDVAPEEDRWYKIEYLRLPTLLSGDDDVPDVDNQFHYAIVLWAANWAFRRGQENESAYAARRDFEQEMRTNAGSYESVGDTYDMIQFSVDVE